MKTAAIIALVLASLYAAGSADCLETNNVEACR